jgi:hypothetical protein
MIVAAVFVSFDWHNDRNYKHLMEAWHANPRFDFTFDDASSGEIDTYNVGRIKGALTTKINAATHTLVIVGAEANMRHRNAALIGYKNWINFEVARSIDAHNNIVAVILRAGNELPEELRGASAYTTVNGFSEVAIIDGLGRAVPAYRR